MRLNLLYIVFVLISVSSVAYSETDEMRSSSELSMDQKFKDGWAIIPDMYIRTFAIDSKSNIIVWDGNESVLYKLDQTGKELWSIPLYGEESGLYGWVDHILTDKNEGFYLMGIMSYFHDTNRDRAPLVDLPVEHSYYRFVAKFNFDGNNVWCRYWIHSECCGEFGILGCDVLVDDFDNLYMVGTYSYQLDIDPGSDAKVIIADEGSGMFALKLNPSGSLLWHVKWDYLNNCSHGNMALYNNEYILFSGYSDNKTDFDPGSDEFYLPDNMDQATYILKLDVDGNFVDAAFLPYSYSYMDCYCWGNNGNLIQKYRYSKTYQVANPTLSNDLEIKTPIYLRKLNMNGNQQWIKIIDASAFISNNVNLRIDNDDNFILWGGFIDTVDLSLNSGTSNYIVSPVNGQSNLFISKFDNNGNFLWAETLTNVSITNVVFDSQNYIYISLFSHVKQDKKIKFDPKMIKLTPDGKKASN